MALDYIDKTSTRVSERERNYFQIHHTGEEGKSLKGVRMFCLLLLSSNSIDVFQIHTRGIKKKSWFVLVAFLCVGV